MKKQNPAADQAAIEESDVGADAATAEAPAEAAAAPAAEAAVKARVLYAGAFGQVDDVVTVDPATGQAGVAAGELDTDPAAVAYAESLKQA